MHTLGKSLVIFGVVLVVVGIVFILGGRLSWFGRLPGDIHIEKRNFTFFFPITTSILISVILSLVFILLRRR